MKFVIILLLAGLFTNAKSQTQSPLRGIGTNFFDFGPITESFQKHEITSSPYLVIGEISQISENGAYIVRKVPNFKTSHEFSEKMMVADVGQQLKMLYALKELEKWRAGQLSMGELMANDSYTKQIILDEIEREKDDYALVRVLVTNCPNASALQGKQVQFFALPVGSCAITDSANNLLLIPRFDYGLLYSGDTSNLSIFLVTKNGLVKKASPQEIETKKEAAAKKLLTWQLRQASNGVAYVQFDLGKRFLKGDGVQKDESLGHYWLTLSADQKYEPAIKLLKQLVN